jgi:hypothetical protein
MAISMPSIHSKRCSCCRVEKTMNEFGRDKYEPDGHRIYCKACVGKKRALRTQERADSLREYMREYNASEKARAARAAYDSSPRGKELRRRSRKTQRARAISLHHTRLRQLRTRGQAAMLGRELRVEIRAIYIEARRLTDATGVPHDVDHIVPLAHGGLHHPSNLRILPASLNRRLGGGLRRAKI